MAKQTPTLQELNAMLHFPKVINDIIYSYIGNPFIFTLDIKDDANIVTIPLISATNNFCINWGDGSYDYIGKFISNLEHKYTKKGKYIVHLHGDIIQLTFDRLEELIEISQWGNLRLFSCAKTFRMCEHLEITARDIINLNYATNMSYMFEGCVGLKADVSKWDVSNATDLSGMFADCIIFTSDLSEWNVSNVNRMSDMFYGCENFNSDLSKWDVRNVTNMSYMFKKCILFNADLSRWDVSNVKHMGRMFEKCKSFNADISNWDVSSVKRMDGIFYKCSSIKFDINKWNIAAKINRASLFKPIDPF